MDHASIFFVILPKLISLGTNPKLAKANPKINAMGEEIKGAKQNKARRINSNVRGFLKELSMFISTGNQKR